MLQLPQDKDTIVLKETRLRFGESLFTKIFLRETLKQFLQKLSNTRHILKGLNNT